MNKAKPTRRSKPSSQQNRNTQNRNTQNRNTQNRNTQNRNTQNRNTQNRNTQKGPDYWSNAHTKHRLRVHLVWVPKYRRRVLQGPVAVRLEALLRQAAQINRWQIHELAIQADHVHLLIQIRPSESVSLVVNRLKGGTSRVVRAEFPELAEFLWGEHFWAEGYFAESVGQVEEAVVSAYIRDQQQ